SSTASAVVVDGLPPSREVTLGRDFACARDAEGTVRCWGGHSGATTATARAHDAALRMELAELHDARGLVAHDRSVCGVRDGRRGAAVRPSPPAPRGRRTVEMIGYVPPPGTARVGRAELDALPETQALALETDHACAAAADGGVWCWGRNEDAAVGDPWSE